MNNEEIEIKYSDSIPPIYEALNKYFGVQWKDGICITYGDTMYCSRPVTRPDLVEHEKVHVRQQALTSPEEWYAKYIHNAEFRLDQELEAYRAQVGWLKDPKNVKYTTREMRRHLIEVLAEQLSSSVYGKIIIYKNALALLK